MSNKIAFLAIGNELLDGRTKESNSAWVGENLRKHGLSLTQTIICDDYVEDIDRSITHLLPTCDILIISGGLGPTSDDLTRDGVAKYLNVPLVKSEESLRHVNEYFSKRNREVNQANLRQAYLPEDAEYINNPLGSAPAFKVIIPKHHLHPHKIIYSLPGVPDEFKSIYNDSVWPEISTKFNNRLSFIERGFRIFGLAESEIAARIESVPLPEDVQVIYRVIFPEIEVLFRAKAGDHNNSLLKSYTTLIEQAIDTQYITSSNSEVDQTIPLEETLKNLAVQKSITIGVAESCTGGMLGSILTALPGSSNFFLGGIQSYSNKVKENLLGVPADLLKQKGAVSEEVAKLMAEGCRKAIGSDIGVSITGVAGPDGGSTEKPVGTFYIGISDGTINFAKRYFFPSSRDRIRRYACYCAMDLLRRITYDESSKMD